MGGVEVVAEGGEGGEGEGGGVEDGDVGAVDLCILLAYSLPIRT